MQYSSGASTPVLFYSFFNSELQTVQTVGVSHQNFYGKQDNLSHIN